MATRILEAFWLARAALRLLRGKGATHNVQAESPLEQNKCQLCCCGSERQFSGGTKEIKDEWKRYDAVEKHKREHRCPDVCFSVQSLLIPEANKRKKPW